MDWPSFEWLHIDCFSALIELASLLPQKEDNLRNRITQVAWIVWHEFWWFRFENAFLFPEFVFNLAMQFLLAVSVLLGEPYLTHIMLPIFLVAVGDNGDLSYFPATHQSRIRGNELKTFWLLTFTSYIMFKPFQIGVDLLFNRFKTKNCCSWKTCCHLRPASSACRCSRIP